MIESVPDRHRTVMPVGHCSRCVDEVWLTQSGRCPFGHSAEDIRDVWLCPPSAGPLPPVLHCTHCGTELYKTVKVCPQCGFDAVSGTEHCRTCGAPAEPDQLLCVECGFELANESEHAAEEEAPRVRSVAAALALMFGPFGVHKFYLGHPAAGVLMLLCLIFTFGYAAVITLPLSIAEGVLYLTKSDEEFRKRYLLGGKAWF